MKNATRRFGLAVVVLGLMAGAAGQARAGLVLYTDRASFSAATSGTQTITFEAQNLNTGNFTSYANGLTVAGVQFTRQPLSHYLFVADGTAVNPAYDWGSGASLLFGSTNEGGNLVVTLPANVTAFGLDFMSQSDTNRQTGEANPFTFTVNGGSTFSATSQFRPNRAFFGVISDSNITNLTLTMTNLAQNRALPIIDNVSFGTADVTAAPEPSTLVGAGIAGLMGLGYAWRRRKANPAA